MQLLRKIRANPANFAQTWQISFLSKIFGLTPPFITPPFVRFQGNGLALDPRGKVRFKEPRGKRRASLGNFTRRKFKISFCLFCGFPEMFEHFVVFHTSPQNLREKRGQTTQRTARAKFPSMPDYDRKRHRATRSKRIA
ncbi:hypothetical protein, partial [Alloalcanivorax venustensis]|uniref:hypothetical protein n=1 Tax=Alloalcanivorax venustensis TaxID=172371 RepID=UPI003C6FED03